MFDRNRVSANLDSSYQRILTAQNSQIRQEKYDNSLNRITQSEMKKLKERNVYSQIRRLLSKWDFSNQNDNSKRLHKLE